MFNKKKLKRQQELLEDYENGIIIQVDNKVDNKKYLEEKRNEEH